MKKDALSPGANDELIAAARELAAEVDELKFKPPVTHVYNPLDYAWPLHEEYLRRYGNHGKRVLFLGMNPGPFGMCQTGIPFGEIHVVQDWLGLHAAIQPPARQHPKRPITGMSCRRSEVSGQRLWKLFADRFGAPEKFFAEHFVVNYCPLCFVEESGRNRTPDKLLKAECERLYGACDKHLGRVIDILRPEWVIGIGGFAAERVRLLAERHPVKIGQILHPSPASPHANQDWAGKVTKQLVELGVWTG